MSKRTRLGKRERAAKRQVRLEEQARIHRVACEPTRPRMLTVNMNESWKSEPRNVRGALELIPYSRKPTGKDKSLTCYINPEQESLLHHFGYKVGKTGLNVVSRRKFLRGFLEVPLPKSLDESLHKKWGSPGSKKRLLETYSQIKRDLLRRNWSIRKEAIRDWEADLRFLSKLGKEKEWL